MKKQMKTEVNYCALRKFTDLNEAVSYMSGLYIPFYDYQRCAFSILDDESFPRYVLYNAFCLVDAERKEGHTDIQIDASLSMDKDGAVHPMFFTPFLLWSKKLGAFYCFHFDTDIKDVSDDEFCEAYSDLIDAYDFPAIMRAAKVIATKRKEKLDRDFDCEIARLREIFGVVIRRLDCDEYENLDSQQGLRPI